MIESLMLALAYRYYRDHRRWGRVASLRGAVWLVRVP